MSGEAARSISGQRGHAAAFSAVVALVRSFDLSAQEALPPALPQE